VPPTIVPERPVAKGPLAARWLWYELPPLRAGVTAHGRAELENAGSAAWIPGPEEQISISYHWLDSLGNPIVWGGIFSPVQRAVAPGERVELYFAVAAPMPPARYRLSLDVVAEGRCWFSELGNAPLELAVEVAPRLERRALVVEVGGVDPLRERTLAALAAQEEPLKPADEAEAVAYLAAGCLPAPDWSRRILDAHSDGYAAVGGSIEPLARAAARRKAASLLAPWTPGSGRKPAFAHPLLCPSVAVGEEASWGEGVAGLPALPSPPEPWLYDGRIRMQVVADGLLL
jgi:hypothetical protein